MRIIINGKRYSRKELQSAYNINYDTYIKRILSGQSPEQAVLPQSCKVSKNCFSTDYSESQYK